MIVYKKFSIQILTMMVSNFPLGNNLCLRCLSSVHSELLLTDWNVITVQSKSMSIIQRKYQLNQTAWAYHSGMKIQISFFFIYRLITAYLLLRVNLDKIMHARWDFDASSAWTRRVSALDEHQNWSASAFFCLNSRAQSKYAVVNLIHTRRKQTFLSFIMW